MLSIARCFETLRDRPRLVSGIAFASSFRAPRRPPPSAWPHGASVVGWGSTSVETWHLRGHAGARTLPCVQAGRISLKRPRSGSPSEASHRLVFFLQCIGQCESFARDWSGHMPTTITAPVAVGFRASNYSVPDKSQTEVTNRGTGRASGLVTPHWKCKGKYREATAACGRTHQTSIVRADRRPTTGGSSSSSDDDHQWLAISVKHWGVFFRRSFKPETQVLCRKFCRFRATTRTSGAEEPRE